MGDILQLLLALMVASQNGAQCIAQPE